MSDEILYSYVRGKGWVPSVIEGYTRDVLYGGVMYRVTILDQRPEFNDRAWAVDHDETLPEIFDHITQHDAPEFGWLVTNKSELWDSTRYVTVITERL